MAENQNVEYKESWRDEYLKWICGFANAQGGTLYIGIDDKGKVCGVKDAKKLLEDIPNKIRTTMGLLCSVENLQEENIDYLKITVEKYPFPVSYHGKYYKRLGSTLQEVTGLELDKMILSVQGRTWDSVPVTNVKVSDLDEASFKLFKKRALFTHRLTEEQLEVENIDLIKNLHGFENEYLTRAAILAFHPDPEKWFTGAFIKIAYFMNDADILYQDEVHGSLLSQVEEAMKIIYTKYMKALIDYDGIARRETYFFPHDAFRELLLNAIIHKDYMKTAPIQIQIFKDKIDIWNIGKMPEDISVEDLYKKHRSDPRNPNIANIFFRCGYVESWGRGYVKIQNLCKEVNAKLPIPEINSGGLSVVCNASDDYMKLALKYGIEDEKSRKCENEELIFSDNGNVPVNEESSQENAIYSADCTVNCTVNCTVSVKITCLAIKNNPKATTEELAKMLNISVRTVKNHQKLLKQAGIIERIGADKNGYWKIRDSGSSPE